MTSRPSDSGQPRSYGLSSPSSIASRLAAINLNWSPTYNLGVRHPRRVSDNLKPNTRKSAASSPQPIEVSQDRQDLRSLLQLIRPKTPCQQPVKPSGSKHVEMKRGESGLRSPKIYQNQIFRDVYDSQGNHYKELFTEETQSKECRERIRVYRRHSASEASPN